jgi:predicted DNA-binding transcriptional regulator YafY
VVWDVEKSAFRSFKLDSVINYEVLEEGYEL